MEPVIVFIDETYAWTSLPDRCEKIFGVYLIDKYTTIHICSMTGSYEAYFLKNHPKTSEGTSDAEKEKIKRWIKKHEDLSEPVSYFSEYCKFENELPIDYTGEVPETLDEQRKIMDQLVSDYNHGKIEYSLPF